MLSSVTAVSSPNRVQRQPSDWSAFLTPISIINLFLICLSVISLAYYISGVNALASGEYHISAKRGEIIKLTEIQSSLSVEKSATENPGAANAFARAQHMTEAKDIVYVFENNNVALQK